jgi:hypothetical protein
LSIKVRLRVVEGADMDDEELGALLDAWAPEPPSLGLTRRIVASAPRAGIEAWRPRRLWISGVGLAAACALGVVAGAEIGRVSLQSAASGSDADLAAAASLENVTVFGASADAGRTDG